MKIRPLLVMSSFVLGILVPLALLWLISDFATSTAAAPFVNPVNEPIEQRLSDATPVHYVAITGADSGDCSTPLDACRTVQYAVDQAGGGDEIRVAAGVYTGVQGRPAPTGYQGPAIITQVVYISKSITVRGGYDVDFTDPSDPEINLTTLDAWGQGRVLFVTGETSPTIEGLCITGGDATGLGGGSWSVDIGGGVYLERSNATIYNNVITSNIGTGMGLFNSVATLQNNTVTSNTGGGIRLYISDGAVLINNYISANVAYYGGGVYLYSSDATLTSNVISGNRVPQNPAYDGVGAGLMIEDSDALIIGNQIISNTAGGNWGSSGGLYLHHSAATFLGNLIIGNRATSEAGGSLRWSPILLHSNIISANVAAYDVGGLSFGQGCIATLSNNIIVNNTAGNTAGGLYFGPDNVVRLVNNFIAGNQAGNIGSGLYIRGASVQLLHNTFASNKGGDGSGVHITRFHISDGSFTHTAYSAVVLTNTILVSHTVGITVASGNTVTLATTLWGVDNWANKTDWDGTGTIITHGLAYWGDPGFINPAVGDFHIGPASAAVDRGINADIHTDIDNLPRPYGIPDIGADEYWPPGMLSTAYLPLITSVRK